MFQKQIIINCQKVDYTLKKYRRQKRVNLIIHQDGSLVVTAPKQISQKFIDNVLKKNSQWIEKNLNKEKTIEIPTNAQDVKKAKQQARNLIELKLGLFNLHYKLNYARITIRSQKTRWGSCSSTGSLNFNYKIVYLPEKLIDYIIVHELCHLQEMNHSKYFWNLVAEEIPDYISRRKELKQVRL